MKIGFYDTDAAGGMIPMIIKLKEEKIPFEEIYDDNLNLVKELDLLIINYLALPHLPKEFLKRKCAGIKKVIESNLNTKFLIMVPGEEWWIPRMNKELGIQKNTDYITDGDISKLTEIIGANIKWKSQQLELADA